MHDTQFLYGFLQHRYAGEHRAVGEMTTPLSMIITGVTMAEAGLLPLLKKKNLFIAVAVRLLLIPAVCIVGFWLLGISGTAAVVTLLL